MKKIPLIALSGVLLLASAVAETKNLGISPSSKALSPLAPQTKIVGGIEAEQDTWPWMTAFVVTYQGTTTSLSVAEITYETASFNFSPAGNVTGEIGDCGIGDNVCTDVQDKVCLIQRGEVDFSEKVNNCEAGGGVGAIIFNNTDGVISGTLGEDFAGTIPVVAVSQDDGATLLEMVGSIATLSVSLQQDASCGASFLGDRWVLTAAHCVDSPDAMLFKMNVGEYDLSDGAEDAIGIKRIYIHHNYDADALDSDLAIVELGSSSTAPAVQIADTELTDQLAIENALATVIGWGGRTGYAPLSGDETSDFPDILHQVDLRLRTNEQCKETLAASFTRDTGFDYTADDIFVSDVMLCASFDGGGKGSCQGDSGGPLIVETNSGPQQIGIVSWGFGCAAEGYPGVYTRVAEFKGWIDSITNGIAITQKHDFGLSLQGNLQSSQLEVVNNSQLTIAPVFSIEGDNSFTVDSSSCATLAAAASCEVTVNFTPESAGLTQAYVVVSTDNAEVASSKSLILADALGTATDLAANAGTVSNSVSWFTGGDLPWLANATEGLESGTITDSQQSVLLAQVAGEGKLVFNWSVSSEENTDPEADEPYDALYLYVNDELIEYISGEVAFTEVSLDLAAGTNEITWIYVKDGAELDGLDKAYVKNVVFTAKVVTPPPTPTPTPTPTPSSSGGGSFGWLLLSLTGLLLFRRK